MWSHGAQQLLCFPDGETERQEGRKGDVQPLKGEWAGMALEPQCFHSASPRTTLQWVLAAAPWRLPALEGSPHPPGIFLEADLLGDREGQDEEEGGDADSELAVRVPAAALSFPRFRHQSSNDCGDSQGGQIVTFHPKGQQLYIFSMGHTYSCPPGLQ